MKRTILISLSAGIFSLVFSIIVGLLSPIYEKEKPTPDISPDITVIHTENESPDCTDSSFAVTLLHSGKVHSLDMHSYLIGVLSAEMPASFQPEALKAQAVAARTYTVHKILSGENENHPNAQICSDTGCCQAFCDENAMLEKWGSNLEKNRTKIETAVLETDGVCAVYQDEPILAAFHSSSCGSTQASGNIWGSDLPYLIPVESPENEKDVPDYKYSVIVSFSDFKDTVASEYPDANFGEDRSTWIGEKITDESMRTESVMIGGINISGTSLRNLFSLRSTAIDLDLTEDGISITTTGYGHGVGLSQYGANALAGKGYSYEDIIAWYYTGTELGSISDFLS